MVEITEEVEYSECSRMIHIPNTCAPILIKKEEQEEEGGEEEREEALTRYMFVYLAIKKADSTEGFSFSTFEYVKEGGKVQHF